MPNRIRMVARDQAGQRTTASEQPTQQLTPIKHGPTSTNQPGPAWLS